MKNQDAVVEFPNQKSKQYVPPRPEGHGIILASFIKKSRAIRLDLASGESVDGFVSQFDDHTITLKRLDSGTLKTFFKHAIDGFSELDVSEH